MNTSRTHSGGPCDNCSTKLNLQNLHRPCPSRLWLFYGQVSSPRPVEPGASWGFDPNNIHSTHLTYHTSHHHQHHHHHSMCHRIWYIYIYTRTVCIYLISYTISMGPRRSRVFKFLSSYCCSPFKEPFAKSNLTVLTLFNATCRAPCAHGGRAQPPTPLLRSLQSVNA